MINISYDHHLNNVNIAIFNRFGMDYSRERRFRCVCCKEPISLDEGYSSRGRRMICDRCLNVKFGGDILKAHAWMLED